MKKGKMLALCGVLLQLSPVVAIVVSMVVVIREVIKMSISDGVVDIDSTVLRDSS